MSSRRFHAAPPSCRALLAGVSLAALALLAVPALAAVSDADLAAGTQLVQKASDGEAGAVDAADAHFTRLLAAEPTDLVLRAYAGASRALQATTTILPWKKLGYAEDGLAQLDKALALLTPAHDQVLHRGVPASLETRFVAANTFLGLPAMFNRRERGERLLDEVMRHPLFERTPAGFRASVWLRAARAAQAAERGAEHKRLLGLVAASGAPQAAAAQAALKELP